MCNSTAAAAGVVSVEVTTYGCDFTGSGVQHELVSVLVSDVTPWSGPQLGGTLVTLVGVGFDDVALSCRFGDAAEGAAAPSVRRSGLPNGAGCSDALGPAAARLYGAAL